jgi:small-conductance mechanosensitive channel
MHTQLVIVQRIIDTLIILTAIAIILMTFSPIKRIGLSIFASASVAGIILGFAAQKILGTILAGIQIAITQPIRLGDVVIVEGEWGWIEEINLTYVVVELWDKRSQIVPTTYFIENNFQNWTRFTSDILGTVIIYTDYMIPVDKLRAELTRLLEKTNLWDGEVNVIQVTDATEKSIQIRILVSAVDAPTAWNLRVYIREKIIEFIRIKYPESLPKTRVNIK